MSYIGPLRKLPCPPPSSYSHSDFRYCSWSCFRRHRAEHRNQLQLNFCKTKDLMVDFMKQSSPPKLRSSRVVMMESVDSHRHRLKDHVADVLQLTGLQFELPCRAVLVSYSQNTESEIKIIRSWFCPGTPT